MNLTHSEKIIIPLLLPIYVRLHHSKLFFEIEQVEISKYKLFPLNSEIIFNHLLMFKFYTKNSSNRFDPGQKDGEQFFFKISKLQ